LRVVIERVTPEVDAGRYPIKRVVGEEVVVEADIFADGHETLRAVVQYRAPGAREWREAPMTLLGNDRWRAEFSVEQLGRYTYAVVAWVDHFKSWQKDLGKKVQAQQDVAVDLLVGARLVEAGAGRARGGDARQLRTWAQELGAVEGRSVEERVALGSSRALGDLMAAYPERGLAARSEPELEVVVDPVLARFGAWYEFFPRSFGARPGGHGTFKDCAAQLERVAAMGFDVVYFPPIHPIGRAYRKGKNNNPVCAAGEPGSPWGIGGAEGGHKSVHPELGTLEDFRGLVRRARELKLEVALDIAFQCSPDHPYVKEHPGWFRQRPDGTIQYAENPPKKYQDIYPFEFETEDWRGLWVELKSVFEFWIEQGVRVYRVDNPHTKAFGFWEWCLNQLKAKHPELIFLSEAFTRPRLMYRLAKLGYTQSYNYFPWRNSKAELTEYFLEITRPPVADFFRPNLWPNTPDILPQYLQDSGRPAFMIRLVLAATLGASYGIYGPAFELCEATPRVPGAEEYLDSEKYELKRWDLGAAHSLQDLITRVNRVRRENAALQTNDGLVFHAIDNDQLLAYTKATPDGGNTILTVVNLDPHHTHHGWLELPLAPFGLAPRQSYQMHDLLTGARFLWTGARNYVELNPQYAPAHIFRLRQRVRTERDFDYFL